MDVDYDEQLEYIEPKTKKPSKKAREQSDKMSKALAQLEAKKLTLDECLTRLANAKGIKVVIPDEEEEDFESQVSSSPSSQASSSSHHF